MSLEIGGRNKSVQYLNMTKCGKESLNDSGAAETCRVSYKTKNTPFLKNQADYLCAVTRFSVPLTEIPIIKQGHSFTVFKYEDAEYLLFRQNMDSFNEFILADVNFLQFVTDNEFDFEIQDPKEVFLDYLGLIGRSFDDYFTNDFLEAQTYDEVYVFNVFLDFVETQADNMVTQVQLPSAFSTFQFLNSIRDALETTTAEVNYLKNDQGVYVDALRTMPRYDLVRTTMLSERIKMTLTPDCRFRGQVTNDGFLKNWYVKMSRGMFSMLQFQTSPTDAIPSTNMTNGDHEKWRLIGRRFHGASNTLSLNILSAENNQTVNELLNSGLTYRKFSTEINQRADLPMGNISDASILANERQTSFQNESIVPLNQMYPYTWVEHTAHMSCADMSRIREIVFSSDLFVLSEGNAENTYKRFLCDFQVFNGTSFSYQVQDMQNVDPYISSEQGFLTKRANMTETLPSHRFFQNSNPSAGRWQDLITPAPLWEIEVRATVKVWDYEDQEYRFEDIPLPAGQQFTVKMIFVSKDNQVVTIAEKPNKYHS